MAEKVRISFRRNKEKNMNKTEATDNKILNVPQQIFEKFLEEMETQKVPKEVIARLGTTLIENERTSVESLKAALFSTDNTGI